MIISFILQTTISAVVVLGVPTAAPAAGLWKRADTLNNWDNIASHHSMPDFQQRSQNLEGVCDAGVKQMSGYLDTADDKHFFYWFFEAQNQTKGKDTDLAVWLNGGPGCSSLGGALTALGPCLMSDSGNSTVRNPYAWNQNTNLLFIDQPTGTGFSYGTPVSNSTAAAADFVQILKLFYKKYPEYYNGGLHIFGESYGGHYLPASAAAIIDYNESSQSDPDFIKLPLKSIAIGNGLYNAKIQYKYLSKMACNSTYPPIFSQDTCDQIDVDYEVCARMIDDCFETNEANKCAIATSYCAIAVVGLYTYDDPNNNPYDVRSKCTTQPACYMKSAYAAEFLNQASVQQALHAKETNYQTCSTDVQITFMSDYDVIRSYDDRLAKVLDAGIPALIYNGDADWLCNWYGVKATMQNMDWSGKDKFNSAQDKPWVVDNKQAGELRASGGLTFLRVFEAGHMLAMDSPVNALAMINEWLENMAITA